MKKSLYMTTALAAAGVLAFGATDVIAAEKAKAKKAVNVSIKTGGYYKTTFGFGQNDGEFESTASATSRTHYDSFDVKADSELYFSGSTTLDSGIDVGVNIHIETDNNAEGTHVDQSDVWFKSKGLGTVTLGHTLHAALSTKGGGTMPGAVGMGSPDVGEWVVRPAALAHNPSTGISAGKAMRVKFLSEETSGFTLALGYTPSSANSDVQPAVGGTAGTDSQIYDAGLKYKAKMGTATMTLDVGYWEQHGTAANSYDALRAGAKLEIGDLTIGGSYKDISDADSANANTNDEKAYEAAIQYTMGDAKVGMGFVNSVKPMTTTVGDDEATQYSIGASLVIGPGVDLLGTLIHVDWDDEGTAAANNNDGWALVGGVKVSF